jgi:hypothetical protein
MDTNTRERKRQPQIYADIGCEWYVARLHALRDSVSLNSLYSLASFFPKIHEQFDLLIRQIKYEEDVCDTSNCAAVALRGFSGERRANFRRTVTLDGETRPKRR